MYYIINKKKGIYGHNDGNNYYMSNQYIVEALVIGNNVDWKSFVMGDGEMAWFQHSMYQLLL